MSSYYFYTLSYGVASLDNAFDWFPVPGTYEKDLEGNLNLQFHRTNGPHLIPGGGDQAFQPGAFTPTLLRGVTGVLSVDVLALDRAAIGAVLSANTTANLVLGPGSVLNAGTTNGIVATAGSFAQIGTDYGGEAGDLLALTGPGFGFGPAGGYIQANTEISDGDSSAIVGGTFQANEAMGGINVRLGGSARVGDAIVGYQPLNMIAFPGSSLFVSVDPDQFNYSSFEVTGAGSTYTGTSIEAGATQPGWIEVYGAGHLTAQTVTLTGVASDGRPTQPIDLVNGQVAYGPVGEGDGLPGLLTVSDPGTQVQIGTLTVGQGGGGSTPSGVFPDSEPDSTDGEVLVNNGGNLNVNRMNFNSGEITADGKSSRFAVTQDLTIGNAGSPASLTVQNGATFQEKGTLTVGDDGMLTVTGQGTTLKVGHMHLDPDDQVTINDGATLVVDQLDDTDGLAEIVDQVGKLIVEKTAQLNATTMEIGKQAQAIFNSAFSMLGQANLQNSGTIKFANTVTIGDGNSETTITSDGVQSSDIFRGDVVVDESGQLIVTDQAQATADKDVTVFSTSSENAAVLAVNSKASLKIGGTLKAYGGVPSLVKISGQGQLTAQEAIVRGRSTLDILSDGIMKVADKLQLDEAAQVTLTNAQLFDDQADVDFSAEVYVGSDAVWKTNSTLTMGVTGGRPLLTVYGQVTTKNFQIGSGVVDVSGGGAVLVGSPDDTAANAMKDGALSVRNSGVLTFMSSGVTTIEGSLYLSSGGKAIANNAIFEVTTNVTLDSADFEVTANSKVKLDGSSKLSHTHLDFENSQLNFGGNLTVIGDNPEASMPDMKVIASDVTVGGNLVLKASADLIDSSATLSVQGSTSLSNVILGVGTNSSVSTASLLLDNSAITFGSGSGTVFDGLSGGAVTDNSGDDLSDGSVVIGSGASGKSLGEGLINGDIVVMPNVTFSASSLKINGLVLGQTGSTIDLGSQIGAAKLEIDGFGQSSTDNLVLHDNGNLVLDSGALQIKAAYTNAAWSSESGDTFDPHAGITENGSQLRGYQASLTLGGSADVHQIAGSTYILQFNGSQFSGYTATFTVTNSGGGASITYGVDSSDVTNTQIASTNNLLADNANSIFTVASGQSQTYMLRWTGNGPLDGQSITLVSDFDNVAPISLLFESPTPLKAQPPKDPSGELSTGDTIPITIPFSEPFTIDTSAGSPTLLLNNGGTATYDPNDTTSDTLAFTYTVGAGERTPDLAISGVDLNGAVIQDSDGNGPDFSGAIDVPIGLQVGSAYVTGVTTTASGEADTGQTVPLTVQVSEGVTVSGTPSLTLNDGASAGYDAGASNPSSGTLVFDYAVGSGDQTPDLTVTGIALNGGSITDPNGVALDTSGADNVATGLRVGLPGVTVTGVSAAATGSAPDDTVTFTLTLSQPVTVDTGSGGTPVLLLNDGASATYDAGATTALDDATKLVFDYTISPGDYTTDLTVTGVGLNEAVIADAAGVNADFSGASGAATGLAVGTSPLAVLDAGASAGEALAGQTFQINVDLTEAATVAGTPTLTLSDGGTATYDANASDPGSGNLAFDYTPGPSDVADDLTIAAVNVPAGASVTDADGYAADFSGAVNQPLGVDIGGTVVEAVTPSVDAGTDVATGQAITLTVALSQPVTVDTTNGSPSLSLDDGATATYDTAASDPPSGSLVFDYTPAAGDYTTDLTVTGANLNGATITDGSGNPADLSGALQPVQLDVNAAVVTGVSAADIGTTVTQGTEPLTVTLNEPVQVSGGTPTLALNSGGVATYDPALSDPATGSLVFDYAVGASDRATDLAATAVALNGATVADASGHAADLSGAIAAPVGLQIGAPLSVVSVTASPTGEADVGQNVQLTVTMSEAVTLDASDGVPTVTLNDGATATYDANASNLAAGQLVFDYTVGANDSTASLAATAVLVPAGSSVVGANGFTADFSGVAGHSTGLQIGPAAVTAVTPSQTGDAETGQSVSLALTMSAPVTVTGTPALILDDGAQAAYDPAHSTATTLEFDYPVAAGQRAADLHVIGINLPTGASVVESANGLPADFTASGDVATGLSINSPLYVATITPSQSGTVQPGTTLTLDLAMSEGGPLLVTGSPSLVLNDGGSATYDPVTSNLNDGVLAFDYTIGSADYTPNLEVSGVDLNGGSVRDPSGYNADFNSDVGALDPGFGVAVGTQLTVASVAASPSSGEADAGQSVQLTLTMSEGAVVTGSPSLSLNDGATAAYDPNASDPSGGTLVFDYSVTAGEETPNLAITTVNLPSGTTVQDSAGHSADFTAALGVSTGLQIGPVYVTEVAASPSGIATSGNAVTLTLDLTGPVTVSEPPTLLLNDGATAGYDQNASNPSIGQLVFDYTVGSGDATPNLSVAAVTGGPVTDASGSNVDFSAALSAPTGLQIGAPLQLASFAVAPNNGEADAGQTITVTLNFNEPVTVDGAPTLSLSDQESATYDPLASNLTAGSLVFDDTVAADDSTEFLYIISVNLPSGASIEDANGFAAQLSTPLYPSTTTLVGPARAFGVENLGSTGSSADLQAGQTATFAIELSRGVTIDTTNGSPTLLLSNSASATLASSQPNPDALAFTYTVGANDSSTVDLGIAAVNLNGATVVDQNGVAADFSGAVGLATGDEVGPAPDPVTIVLASPTGEADTGTAVTLTLAAMTPVQVDTSNGTPTLTLNDGATATYDAAASSAYRYTGSGTAKLTALVFDYTVGANDHVGNLAVSSVDLHGGSVTDADGTPLNFATAIGAGTGLQINPSPLTPTAMTVSPGGVAEAGDALQVTLAMSEAVTVGAGNDLPVLMLNNGDSAVFDAAASDPSSGSLVFDDAVGGGSAHDLVATGIELHGTKITDINGFNADFSNLPNIGSGAEVTPLTVQYVVSSPGDEVNGDATAQVTLGLSELTNVTGTQSLELSDGTTAPFDPVASDLPDGQLVFDYTSPSADIAPGVVITGVDPPSTTSITDANGYDADFADAIGQDVMPCFLRGTMILTPTGEVPVEQLKIGDIVATLSGAARPITWIGSGRSLVTAANQRSRPIILRRNAIEDGVPCRDLYVTKGHSLYLDGVLIPAESLVNGCSIVWEEAARVVEFYHIELPSHDVLIADGAPAESYKEDGNRDQFHNPDRPAIAAGEAKWFAPVLANGPEMERVWLRLLERSGFKPPPLTRDPDLHLVADGLRIDAFAVEARAYRFRLEKPPCELRIASSSAVPCAIGRNPDQRRLGVAIRSMSLQGNGASVSLSHDRPSLSDGFHAAEAELRWTNGSALVPGQALLAFGGGFELMLCLGAGMEYPRPAADIPAEHAAASPVLGIVTA